MPNEFATDSTAMRTWLRNQLFQFIGRVFSADHGKDILTDALQGQLARPTCLPNPQLLAESPYPDVGGASVASKLGHDGHGAVFITGRFRSGSTLLWNIFRHTAGCTAFYEPLNERRWFDLQARGKHTDKTHQHVEDYWREYDGLGELASYYREDWIRCHLYMEAGAWDPALKRYIEILIERAPERAVLQFNRVDFRLAWLRAHFPSAKIIHLYRHPREQWLSIFRGGPVFPRSGRVADFGPFDNFYLLMWARDLSRQFPFLRECQTEHPYQLFYLIWRLSYLFGRHYADWSLAFESLVQDPRDELSRLFDILGLGQVEDRILGLIERPQLGKWTSYADATWFADHEAECERTLAEFFAATPAAHGLIEA